MLHPEKIWPLGAMSLLKKDFIFRDNYGLLEEMMFVGVYVA